MPISFNYSSSISSAVQSNWLATLSQPFASAAYATLDGGSLIVGEVSTAGAGLNDVLVIKMTANGNV